jgi:hypothetical protein
MSDVLETTEVTADVVRAWARGRGIEVGTRGHLSVELTDKFNRAHRKQRYVNRNPSVVGK